MDPSIPIQPKELVRTQYGLMNESDIPILIPDSSLRGGLYILLSVAVIVVICIVFLVSKNDYQKSFIWIPTEEPSKPAHNEYLDFYLPDVRGRYIYVYSEPETQPDLHVLHINNASIKFTVERLPSGILIDLMRVYAIRLLTISLSKGIENIVIRDATGTKTFSYL